MTALLHGLDIREASRAPLARADPAAKLAVATVISVALILTVDPVTAGVALALELAFLPWCGLSPRKLFRSSWIILLGAVPAGLLTLVFGVDGGDVLLGLGPVSVTEGSLSSAVAITLRILAIGLPGVVLLATTDPTDLADSLAQILRLPHRFVLSALAALRLVGLLAQEWQTLTMARRARGFDHGLRQLLGQVFALLVIAIRRGTVLATTMEARGFGVDAPRTWARPAHFGLFDWAVVLGGVAVAALATGAGLWLGTWNLVLA
ncbi:energy-coupling factor transporter transmembrane component T family protein [Kineosporia succinea]|uniref:Energy-coupling factor transport system permease protein n=1 Tax=Kineosporia succinea TaxID=84632 RepID=A0ABT9P1M3_9ACTN|nr:energy-coupling factor transporter transmembrane component T [Kineosporia succinea]MDP9826583.1 energy-coupling factor transport system permease protein [Kineosporia succinea]